MKKLWQDRNWLYKHYIVREKSTVVMAKEAGCNPVTINYWLRKLGIAVRDRGEGVFLARRNSVIITPGLLGFLEGELQGDGNVSMMGNRSARYQHGSALEKYLIWLSECFDAWGIEQSGRITKHISKKSGTIFYSYASRSYPELVPIYKAWYSKRDGKMKKIIPEGFKLTSMRARQWYIGDGCLEHPAHSRPYIYFSTHDFDIDSVNYLIRELQKQGFKATRWPSNNCIDLSVHSVQDFLKWIGPCPIACYDYKWDYEKS